MVCGYSACKFGGQVEKIDGIKVGSRWFHKECVREKELKQEIEKYWLSEINAGTILQVLRKAINDLTKLYEADYVLWVIKECKPRRINLSYPMGLKKLCDDNKFKDEWNKKKVAAQYLHIKDDICSASTEEVIFNYIPSGKKITDII